MRSGSLSSSSGAAAILSLGDAVAVEESGSSSSDGSDGDGGGGVFDEYAEGRIDSEAQLGARSLPAFPRDRGDDPRMARRWDSLLDLHARILESEKRRGHPTGDPSGVLVRLDSMVSSPGNTGSAGRRLSTGGGVARSVRSLGTLAPIAEEAAMEQYRMEGAAVVEGTFFFFFFFFFFFLQDLIASARLTPHRNTNQNPTKK